MYFGEAKTSLPALLGTLLKFVEAFKQVQASLKTKPRYKSK